MYLLCIDYTQIPDPEQSPLSDDGLQPETIAKKSGRNATRNRIPAACADP